MRSLEANTPVLFCEGPDDEALLGWLRDRSGVVGLQIAQEGVGSLVNDMQALLKGLPGGIPPATVGLVLDADNDPRARREAAKDALQRVAPASRHGIYLLPDNGANGMLEDLYLSVCRFPELASCARHYVACARDHYPENFNASKVGYQAYRSVVRFGQRAIKHGLNEGDVDPSHPTLSPLVAFLRDLASSL